MTTQEIITTKKELLKRYENIEAILDSIFNCANNESYSDIGTLAERADDEVKSLLNVNKELVEALEEAVKTIDYLNSIISGQDDELEVLKIKYDSMIDFEENRTYFS